MPAGLNWQLRQYQEFGGVKRKELPTPTRVPEEL